MLIFNGVLTVMAQYLFVRGLQLDKAGRGASLFFLSIVFAYICDILLFNYDLQLTEFLGALVILIASTFAFAFKYYYSPNQKEKEKQDIAKNTNSMSVDAEAKQITQKKDNNAVNSSL